MTERVGCPSKCQALFPQINDDVLVGGVVGIWSDQVNTGQQRDNFLSYLTSLSSFIPFLLLNNMAKTALLLLLLALVTLSFTPGVYAFGAGAYSSLHTVSFVLHMLKDVQTTNRKHSFLFIP